MAGLEKMFRGMAVQRVVATAHVPTAETKAQMHPITPYSQALLTSLRSSGRDVFDLIDVLAAGIHFLPLSLS